MGLSLTTGLIKLALDKYFLFYFFNMLKPTEFAQLMYCVWSMNILCVF